MTLSRLNAVFLGVLTYASGVFIAIQVWSDYTGASIAIIVLLGGYAVLFVAFLLEIDRRFGPMAASLFYEHKLVFPLVGVTGFGIGWTAFNIPANPTWEYHLSLVGIMVGIQITSYKISDFAKSIPKRQGIQPSEVACTISWVGQSRLGAGQRSLGGSLSGAQRNVWGESEDLNGVFEISLIPVHPNFNGTVTALHLRRLKQLSPNLRQDKQIWTTKRSWSPIYPLVVVDLQGLRINTGGEDLAFALRGALASESGVSNEKIFRVGANVGRSDDSGWFDTGGMFQLIVVFDDGRTASASVTIT